jgi:predicted Zn-dependent protease
MNAIPNGRLPFSPDDVVVVVPMDGPPAGEVVQLVVDLQREGVYATLAEAVALPDSAHNRVRGQYRAELLLAAARRLDGRRILGVTGRDMYGEGTSFLFGIADSPGRAALISLAQLRSGDNPHAVHARALKEAIHELGHTLGLRRCENARCVMHFSSSVAETDHKTSRLCDACLLQASRLGRGER